MKSSIKHDSGENVSVISTMQHVSAIILLRPCRNHSPLFHTVCLDRAFFLFDEVVDML